MTDEKNFWVSWYGSKTPFTLEWPWWISGYRVMANRLAFDEEWDQPTICAAVRAADKQAAADLIVAAHDEPPSDLEWRFLEERPDDWSPYCDRFPKADWMRWPDSQATR